MNFILGAGGAGGDQVISTEGILFVDEFRPTVLLRGVTGDIVMLPAPKCSDPLSIEFFRDRRETSSN